MDVGDRLEINAAIERLVADGPCFDPIDAAVVIAKVPVTQGAGGFEFTFDDKTPRRGFEAFAGAGGRGPGDGKGVSKRYSTVADPVRVGGYKLRHRPGRVEIELMWADTDLDMAGRRRNGSAVALDYDRGTRRPNALRILKIIPFMFILWPKPRISFALDLMAYVAWKKPGAPGGLAVQAKQQDSIPSPERFRGADDHRLIVLA